MLAPRNRTLLLLLALAWPAILSAADIASGPMVGAPEMRSAPLWVQTDGPAEVAFAYWPAENPSQRVVTPKAAAKLENAYVVELTAGPLKPGTAYEYEVLIDGGPVKLPHEAKFTTAPFYTDRAPPPDFTVALGGGHRVNDPDYDPLNRTPGDGYDIFLAILAKNPAFMLWTGNNVILREPDWGSRAGMLARYSMNRAQPELQPLLAAVPSVAVVSQGEFGPDRAGKYFRNREDAQEAFELFWGNPPAIASTDSLGTTIRYGDAEFFLVDDRSNRDLAHDIDKYRKVLGEEQLAWLRQALRESKATFKVIVTGSSALNPSDSPLNHKVAEIERDAMLEDFSGDKINGLFIVAGGKDYGELTKMVRPNAPDLYELSTGPLTDRPAESTKELNYFRVPSTSTFQRTFALLKFHGPEGNRQMSITVCNSVGDQLWSQTIAAADMRFK